MSDEAEVPAIANAVVRSLERTLILTRETTIAHSAWRMEIQCDDGIGAITLIHASAHQPLYRGAGLFLGWSQEQLAAVYLRLQAGNDEPPMEMLQLG